MIYVCPTDVCIRNLRQKAEKGKITGSESATRFPRVFCFKKPMHSVPKIWVYTYVILPWSAKGTRKRDEKLDYRATEKGAKKLVSSNFAKILE
jgi:hypothetical protein